MSRALLFTFISMIEWVTILALVAMGIILILVELIFVPGTTIVGIFGLILCAVGVFLGFDYFGTQTGWLVLAGTSLVGVIAIVAGLRSGSWQKFALKRAMESHVNDDLQPRVVVGDVGVTTSALRPIGKAEIADQLMEVRTIGDYIDSSEKIKVVAIEDGKIIVELNTEA